MLVKNRTNTIVVWLAFIVTITGVILFTMNPIISVYGHLMMTFASLIWMRIAYLSNDKRFMIGLIIFALINFGIFIF